MLVVDNPQLLSDIVLAVERDFVNEVVSSVVHRSGYYAFDDYGYPFHLLGLVRIDSEKALIAVNPEQGYFIYRKRMETGKCPSTKLLYLNEALTIPFGEPSDWLKIEYYQYENPNV